MTPHAGACKLRIEKVQVQKVLIHFHNEDTRLTYSSEAVVALVGKNATSQFCNISLTVDELRHAIPFACFDTPSKEDNEITNKRNDSMKERLVLCKTDMLFVLSDFDSNEDCSACVRYVTQLKEHGWSFLVTHERNRKSNVITQIANRFCHIIFVENDVDNLFCPVKQLLIDYCRSSFIGIDMADVLSVYPNNSKRQSSFTRYSFPNIHTMKASIPEILSWVKTKKSDFYLHPDFMLFMNVPHTVGLDDIEEIAVSMIEDCNDSEIIWAYNFNAADDDNSCMLLLQIIFPRIDN